MAKQKGTGSGCLILFGSVFFLAGCLPGFFAISQLYNSHQAQSWKQVPATLDRIDLNYSTSDGSTTYSTSGSFSYQFGGQTYTSDQIDFSSGSDNVGSYHQDLYNRLKNKEGQRSAITAYVNPDSPADAVLEPNIRWGMFAFLLLFFVVFSGVGLGIMLMGFFGGKMVAKENRLKSDHPSEPWKWKADWQDGRISCGNKAGMWVLIVFASFWNIISWPAAIMVTVDDSNKSWLAYLVYLFPLIGAILIYAALLAVLKWRRYGKTELVSSYFPAEPGGRLLATIESPNEIDAREMNLKLVCNRVKRVRSGKNTSTRTEALWEHETTSRIAKLGPNNRCKIDVSIAIPPDALESDDSNPRNRIEWKLIAKAETPGVDFSADYVVPVFRRSGAGNN